MSEANRCPRCGGERPAGAVEGLCPRCLLGQALDLGVPSSAQRDPIGRLRSSKVPWAPRESATSARSEAGAYHSVLGTLADSLGTVPRILLCETEPGGLTPLVRPASAEVPAEDPGRERYQFLGEIARGGMGAVLKGRDTDLGRDLAVKVLLEKHRDNPGLIRRFVEEAQIGGQLQHPGIVPVYELGCFEDRRPFFTMKLVKGHTLAASLDARRDPSHDRPRFLAIFEAICQTMAYAHARGVIHRDLKPQNVMVGSFGEVQVMDWGLAKVLRTAFVIDERAPDHERETAVETARSASETYASHAGSVMGTPGYMPPEQASGEVDAVDERADVFALGAILCEILTGHPPYSGRTFAEIHRKAVAGDLTEALDRLAGCGAEAELLELSRRCLAPRANDRHRDAGEVARAMTAYLAGVQDRLRTAELARVEAQARTEEERKRRKTQLRMAAAILMALAMGTVGVAVQWNRAESHRLDAESHLRTAEARFGLAREAIERFYTGASEDVLLKEPQFKELREKLLGSSLEFYKKLQASLEAESGDVPRAELAAAYESVGEITGKIGSKPAAIDAFQRAREIRQRLAERGRDRPEAQAELAGVLDKLTMSLAEVGRAAEAVAASEQSQAIYQRLADAEPGFVGHRIKLAQSYSRLGYVLGYRLGRMPDAMEAVERAIAVYAGFPRESSGRPDVLRGVAEAQYAKGLLLHQMGRSAESFEPMCRVVAACDRIIQLEPQDLEIRERLGRALMNVGTVETNLSHLDAAGQSFRRALTNFEGLVRKRPNDLQLAHDLGRAHQSLAWWLGRVDRKIESLEEYRRAVEVFDRLIRDDPSVSEYASRKGLSLTNVGDILRSQGRLDEALQTLRQAQVVIEKVTREHPDVPQYQGMTADLAINVAAVLYEMGRRVEAKGAYEHALVKHDQLRNKTDVDQFNIACLHARITVLVSAEPDGSTPARREEVARHLDHAMDALFAAVEGGYREWSKFAADPDLDPLRARPDFQRLLMDLAFPDDPFAA
jgi:tetratricopeptide (TPR) repeat protein/tRNA A-37 threonylcarbamoyl transferase component Bud32